MPVALTIAGSDSGGGAGIQADLRTFHAFKVYGSSVITAVTAQNPGEVRRVDVMSADSVGAQLETVLDAFPVRFAKTGMLGSRAIVERVAELATRYRLRLVVDPVMVSTSGARLLEESAMAAVREKLFPAADWITPNIPEAEFICGRELTSPADLAEAAGMLYRQYRCHVILKSGHAIASDRVSDIVCYQGEIFTLTSPAAKVAGHTAHGTGCTLSAALAANFALGRTWREALTAAKAFVYGSLCECVRLSGTLAQMYPPEQDPSGRIVLEKYR